MLLTGFMDLRLAVRREHFKTSPEDGVTFSDLYITTRYFHLNFQKKSKRSCGSHHQRDPDAVEVSVQLDVQVS